MKTRSDNTEEVRQDGIDIGRYMDVVRRRHMYFLVPLLATWLLVWGVSWLLPARYKSVTLILVEQPTMPKNYVQPNVNEDLQARLQSISQQILSRTRLLMIIDKLHLYSGGRKPLTPDAKVEMMRNDIQIELVQNKKSQEITAFNIYYSANDPRMAQQVTGELTDLFIDENIKVRQQDSEGTTKFLQSQLQNARATLAEQETKIREFKMMHQGELPSQQASHLQILSGLQAQLQSEQTALNTAKQQRVYYQSLLQQYQTAADSADGSGTSDDLPALDRQLETLRSRLNNLKARYTDEYPDVQSAKAEIARIEKARADILAAASKAASQKPGDSKKSAATAAVNRTQNAPLMQVEGQLQANETEITNREQSIVALKARINEYQTRLNAEPAREQELADLSRGYDQTKAYYDDLLKKKNDSEMATSMEQMQRGERFTMLDPPSLPDKPDFPNRLKFCGIAVGAGLAIGLLVVILLELLDHRVYRANEFPDLLPVPILSEIPVVTLPSETRSLARRASLGWAMTVLVAIAIAGGTTVSYLWG